MKKIFRWLFILIIVLIAGFFIMGLILPEKYHVERSLTINTSYDNVYSNINNLRAMTNWSPWVDYDPDMKMEFEGINGKVGSKFSWIGNEDVGKGSQEIISITENQIKTRINFVEPMETEATGTIDIRQKNEGIEVIWKFDGYTPYPWNALSLFMNMDDMLGKDFERGLEKLDSMCNLTFNSMSKKYHGYHISEIDYGPKTFIGFRDMIQYANVQKFYATHFGLLYEFYTTKKNDFSGYPSGIFLSYDEAKGEAEMLAAVPVNIENPDLPNGYEIIPAEGKALFIEYKGPYNKSSEAHYAMTDYMKEKGLELNELVIEEYVTDPSSKVDSTEWIINIIYLIKE